MENYELESDEVILFKDVVTHNKIKGKLQLTLTSRKIILEKEKGIVKKEKILMDIINLEDIKIYNEKVQVKQKGPEVTIQTIKDNIIITFDGMFKANKFIGKIVDAVTGTTFTKRSTEKIKGAFDTVDDVLGIDTRGTLKGVVENGIASTLLKGLKKKIIDFIEIEGTSEEKIEKLKKLEIKNETFITGVNELEFVIKNMGTFGIPKENYKVDLTIARGLDYYTGTVYETFLNEYRELGSVCSGGRYENLAEYYTDKKLPGVGVSIGLTRLFYKLNELNLIKAKKKSISDVLIIPMIEDLTVPIEIASELRKSDIKTEIYLNNKKLKAKFKYADKLEIPYVVVIGEDEIEENKYKLKDMKTGNEQLVDISQMIRILKQ